MTAQSIRLMACLVAALVTGCATTPPQPIVEVPESTTAEPLSVTAILRSGKVRPELPDLSRGDYGRIANKYLLRYYSEYADSIEVYCGCTFETPSKAIEPDTCEFDADVPRDDDVTRAARIEWEHVVPAAKLVERYDCASRAKCRGVPEFVAAESDPNNLLPALGSLNARRSNHPYGEVPGEPRVFGGCDFEHRAFKREGQKHAEYEPPEDVKGNVARISLYMAHRYEIEFSEAELALFEAWSAQDPVDDAEHHRARWIEENITGWNYEFVE